MTTNSLKSTQRPNLTEHVAPCCTLYYEAECFQVSESEADSEKAGLSARKHAHAPLPILERQ